MVPADGRRVALQQRIILIRAINVGGTARLPMAELRELATGLGATGVSTYIASGNLICTVPGDPDRFDEALQQAIEFRFGFVRDVISRSPAELRDALAAHPFAVLEPKFSYVTFLGSAPTAEAIAKAETFPTNGDEWRVIGREMHIRYVDGAGRPRMKGESIGRTLGVPGTARNLLTVAKLIELAG